MERPGTSIVIYFISLLRNLMEAKNPQNLLQAGKLVVIDLVKGSKVRV